MLQSPRRDQHFGVRGPDIAQARFQLNVIAQSAFPALVTDGAFAPRTISRVNKFQQFSRVSSDGVVGPESRAKLDELTSDIVALVVPPTNTVNDWRRNQFRESVIGMALAEARPFSNAADDTAATNAEHEDQSQAIHAALFICDDQIVVRSDD